MGPTRPLTDCITEAQLTKLAGAMDEVRSRVPAFDRAARRWRRRRDPFINTGTSSTARTSLGRATRARPSTSSRLVLSK